MESLSILNFLRVYKVFINKYGKSEGIFLSEIVDKCFQYAQEGKLDDEGYFYHDMKNIYLRTGIKKKLQDKLRKNLERKGILLTKKDTKNKNKLKYSIDTCEWNKIFYPKTSQYWKDEITSSTLSDKQFLQFPGVLSIALGVNNTLFIKHLNEKREIFKGDGKLVDGYFFSPLLKVEAETGLTRKQQDKCKKDLIDLGIIDSHNGRDREGIEGSFQKDCRWMKIYFSNISIIEREIGKVYNDYYTNSIKTEKVKKIEDIIKQLEGLFETKIIELTPTFVSTVEEDIKSLYGDITRDCYPQKDIPESSKGTNLLSSEGHTGNPGKDILISSKEQSETLEGATVKSSKEQSESTKGPTNNNKNYNKTNNTKRESSFDILENNFETFWNTYPSIKKQNKESSKREYQILITSDKEGKLHDYIIYHLKELHAFRKNNNDTSFLPAPNKWLENKSYLDEYSGIKTFDDYIQENYDMISYVKNTEDISIKKNIQTEEIKSELEDIFEKDIDRFTNIITKVLSEKKYLIGIFSKNKKASVIKSIIRTASVEVENKYDYKKGFFENFI